MLIDAITPAFISIWEIVSMDSIAFLPTPSKDKWSSLSPAFKFAESYTMKTIAQRETDADFHMI